MIKTLVNKFRRLLLGVDPLRVDRKLDQQDHYNRNTRVELRTTIDQFGGHYVDQLVRLSNRLDLLDKRIKKLEPLKKSSTKTKKGDKNVCKN